MNEQYSRPTAHSQIIYKKGFTTEFNCRNPGKHTFFFLFSIDIKSFQQHVGWQPGNVKHVHSARPLCLVLCGKGLGSTVASVEVPCNRCFQRLNRLVHRFENVYVSRLI
jgi:hypothetical protein